MLRLNLTHLAPPNVFVGSTADALVAEWRDSLTEYLTENGFKVMMWEDGKHFPYLQNGTIPLAENAIKAVAISHMCIFILGERYGSLDKERDKSWTHSEFLEAVNKRLPVYVFVNERVWQLFRLFEQKQIGKVAKDLEKQLAFIDDIKKHNIFLYKFKSSDDIIRVLKEKFSVLLGSLLRFAKEADWIWCEEKTEEIEKSAKEVWIGTPDLYWDVENERFREIVRYNVIKRKTPYRYIVIDTRENRLRFRSMMGYYKEQLGFTPDFIQVRWLPKDRFPWPTEIAIYNPNDEKSPRAVIVNAMEVSNRDNKYNVELGFNSRMRLIETFRRLFES